MHELVMVRGLPGSGKTTLMRMLHIDCDSREGMSRESRAVSADDYFTRNDNYFFNPSKLGDAHEYCRKTVEQLLSDYDIDRRIMVHNTFSQRWEMEPYIKLAELYNAKLIVIDLFDGGLTDEALVARNVHGVPLQTMGQMRSRWEHDWRSGNPLAPWNRK